MITLGVVFALLAAVLFWWIGKPDDRLMYAVLLGIGALLVIGILAAIGLLPIFRLGTMP